ncbi:unnamed protein product [Anisakis simplex]|uniref:Major sperm protein (inferred by orthology to a C. elegans protein) n=1 Tax=Anisakis simplex TaxID=6269 RepID=A0A0M3JW30_ANISI|nr:unnamed protein product [Anisakis simplex]
MASSFYLPIPKKVSVKQACGGTPDYELTLLPGWLVFSADNHYTKAQYAHFMIQNNESVPVVYRIRTKDDFEDRSFPQFSYCHGYLSPKGSDELTIFIPAKEHWPREVSDFAGRRHKVLIEHLTVPSSTTPPINASKMHKNSQHIVNCWFAKSPKNCLQAAADLSRIIFKFTPALTRTYCKLNFILPKLLTGTVQTERSNNQPSEVSTPSK